MVCRTDGGRKRENAVLRVIAKVAQTCFALLYTVYPDGTAYPINVGTPAFGAAGAAINLSFPAAKGATIKGS